MGTRASVVLQGKYSVIYLYKHSDGHPESVLPQIRKARNFVLDDRKYYYNIERIAHLFSEGFEYRPVGRITADLEYLYFIFCVEDEGEFFDVRVKELKYVDWKRLENWDEIWVNEKKIFSIQEEANK